MVSLFSVFEPKKELCCYVIQLLHPLSCFPPAGGLKPSRKMLEGQLIDDLCWSYLYIGSLCRLRFQEFSKLPRLFANFIDIYKTWRQTTGSGHRLDTWTCHSCDATIQHVLAKCTVRDSSTRNNFTISIKQQWSMPAPKIFVSKNCGQV